MTMPYPTCVTPKDNRDIANWLREMAPHIEADEHPSLHGLLIVQDFGNGMLTFSAAGRPIDLLKVFGGDQHHPNPTQGSARTQGVPQ